MVENISEFDMGADFFTNVLTIVQIKEANDRVQLVGVKTWQKTASAYFGK